MSDRCDHTMELSMYAFCVGMNPATYCRKYSNLENLERSYEYMKTDY